MALKYKTNFKNIKNKKHLFTNIMITNEIIKVNHNLMKQRNERHKFGDDK